MLLSRRIEAAIEAAPLIELNQAVPIVDSQGDVILSISDRPDNELRGLEDYDPCTLNAGHVEPLNAVEVTEDRYHKLFNAYTWLLFRNTGDWPRNISQGRDSTVRHERRHGRTFQALGAHAVRYGMRFGRTYDAHGEPAVAMSAYVVAPDLQTFKLGIAAMLAAPPEPSETDLAGIHNLGYTPMSIATRIKLHNLLGRRPFIPELGVRYSREELSKTGFWGRIVASQFSIPINVERIT